MEGKKHVLPEWEVLSISEVLEFYVGAGEHAYGLVAGRASIRHQSFFGDLGVETP